MPPIDGEAALWFERVEAAFRENFAERDELGGARAAYHRGGTVTVARS